MASIECATERDTVSLTTNVEQFPTKAFGIRPYCRNKNTTGVKSKVIISIEFRCRRYWSYVPTLRTRIHKLSNSQIRS